MATKKTPAKNQGDSTQESPKKSKSESKKPAKALIPRNTSAVKVQQGGKPSQVVESRHASDSEKDFHVVGVGSSAGGLEALGLFFRGLKEEIGIAFVLVQHQDPSKKSLLPELVSRFCILPVKEVTAGMKVEKDTVFINTPQNDLTIKDGKFYMMEPPEPGACVSR
jgi:chemotaxis response regulator CheB